MVLTHVDLIEKLLLYNRVYFRLVSFEPFLCIYGSVCSLRSEIAQAEDYGGSTGGARLGGVDSAAVFVCVCVCVLSLDVV